MERDRRRGRHDLRRRHRPARGTQTRASGTGAGHAGTETAGTREPRLRKEWAPRRHGQRRNVDDPGHHRESDARGNAYPDERGARRNGEPVRTRAQQRAVAGGTVREHLRRAHRVTAAPARCCATAGLGTARRPAAAGGDDGRGNPLPGHVVDHKGGRGGQNGPRTRDCEDASFTSAGWRRPGSYGVRRFGDDRGYITNCDRHDHRSRPGSRPPRECPRPWPSR